MTTQRGRRGSARPSFLIAGGLIVLLAVGGWFYMLHSQRTDLAAAVNEGAPTPMVPHTQTGERMQSAGARIKILGTSENSVRLTLTFPDSSTVEELFTIKPGEHFQPSQDQADGAARKQHKTLGGKITARANAKGGTHWQLDYFVPAEEFPDELRAPFFGAAATTWNFTFVRAAYASEGDGLGASMSMGADVAERIDNINSALEKNEDHNSWMEKLNALEECARNPTNTLTQDAYRQNPAYQQQTLQAIAEARSEVKQASAMRFLNQETSLATGLVEGPMGKLMGATGPVGDWNDSTLKDIATQRIDDISKLVDCKLAPPPPPYHGDGQIKYHMHREGYLDFDEEDSSVRGTFDISPVQPTPGYVTLDGDGSFKYKSRSSRFGTSNNCEGTSKIDGGGNAGDLVISGGPAGGGCRYVERGKASDRPFGDSDAAFSCRFHDVDLENGGSYNGVVEGEEASWATCEVDLTPQRR